MTKKRWNVAEPCPDICLAEQSPVRRQLLWNRGIRTPEEAAAFLNPSWEDGIHDPSHFRHMEDAVLRFFRAVESGERITVHGDYDADGVTGAAVIMSTLRQIGVVPDFYIPHRDREGYGLHRETVERLHERGTNLIITVDCGIACVDEIRLAKERGMDVIVVDHHQFGKTLPDAYLIHPGLPGETYPFKHLAAVGVAYKFACAILAEARRRGIAVSVGWEKWLLDLVAIATVTDMVPLVGENRVLQSFGLRVLNKTRRPGLRALCEIAGLTPPLDTESIGFAIGPRINAAGRMEHASLALELLLAEEAASARSLALELERCNRERQEATRKMMEEAEEILESRNKEEETWPIIALWKKGWSPALVGLVAGKFADRFARPVIIIGHHQGTWIGSGRSIRMYDITEAVRSAGEGILTRVGGHPQACGFALQDEARLQELSERLTAHASSALSEECLIPTIQIDAELPLASITPSFVEDLERLAPFGEGNRRPVFLSRRLPVVSADLMGAQKNHLRLVILAEDGRRIKCVGFKEGARLSELKIGEPIDLVYTMTVNEWNGRKEAELRLIDLCTS